MQNIGPLPTRDRLKQHAATLWPREQTVRAVFQCAFAGETRPGDLRARQNRCGHLRKDFQCLARLNLVGAQLNQILGKRAPLLHLMFGKPGKISPEQTAATSEAVPE